MLRELREASGELFQDESIFGCVGRWQVGFERMGFF